MGNATANLINNLNMTVNCFGFESKKKKRLQKLYDVTEKLKISILPISLDFDLDNLYPIHNHVSNWNIFVVGKDKRYILGNIGNENCLLSKRYLNVKSEDLVDGFGDSFPPELFTFFDSVWDITLKGQNLQLYVMIAGKLYLINTYKLTNDKNNVIGACLFMRDFQNADEFFAKLPSHLIKTI